MEAWSDTDRSLFDTWNEMDIPKLIREVRCRPAVWNQKSTNYYNRDIVTKTWEEISALCDMPYDAVKCKWKHLRDNFRKEFKKCLKETGYQSDPERYDSGWVWFKSLNFLANQLSAKRITTQLQTDKQRAAVKETNRPPVQQFSLYNKMASQNDEDTSEDFKPFYDTDDSQGFSDEEYSSNESPNMVLKKRSQPDLDSKRKRSRPSTVHRETDDTYYFLMSLMKPLKMLPFERQMMARLKIQEIISKEITQLHSGYPKELKDEIPSGGLNMTTMNQLC